MEAPLSNKKQMRTVSRFREVLPQVLAMSAASCVIMDMAVTFMFSTLVIADLHHSSEDLSFDDTQASWFGGLPYLCQPIGSIASGFLVTFFGRKRSLMLITLPYILGCVLMSTAPSVFVLFITNFVIGVTVGFTEAPINSYYGEICQPELRSILAGSAALFYQIGMCIVLLLGSLMHWRTTAAVSVIMPTLTLLFLSQVPESPIWLIAQGRKKDAEAALCWLRGWVEPSAVQQELADLERYYETTAKSNDHDSKYKQPPQERVHMQTMNVSQFQQTPEQLSLLPQHDKQCPDSHLEAKQATDDTTSESTQISQETNQVQAFNITQVEQPPEQIMLIMLPKNGNQSPNNRMAKTLTKDDTEVKILRRLSVTMVENGPFSEVDRGGREESKQGSSLSKFVVKAKLLLEPETMRPLTLVFLIFVFSGMGGMLSIKPFMVEVLQRFHAPIDPKWSSVVLAAAGFLGSIFLMVAVSFIGKRKMGLWSTAACAVSCLLLGLYAFLAIKSAKDSGDDSYLVATWMPLALFSLLSFASAVQGQLPWLLVAESFPFRTRGVAGGLAAGSMYLVAFFASKTYLATEKSFELHGAFWFYGVINCACLVYLYFQLPETEGKSLEEIERLYADNKRRIK